MPYRLLARAFYHEREIILLDEATAALDNDTELEVMKEIESLRGDKTLVVIAHRLTTVRHCDVIYRLGSGRIIKRGDYQSVVGPADGESRNSLAGTAG